MKPLLLRTRIALASAAVITVSILLCGVVTTLIARHEGIEELDLQLKAEAQHFFDEWQRHGGPGNYDLTDKANSIREWLPSNRPQRLAEISREDETIIFRSKHLHDKSLHTQSPGARTVDANGRAWRFLGVRKDGITLRIAADLEPVEELTSKLITAFAVAGPLLLGFAVLSSHWVAGRALEPVRRIAAVAERITAEQLDDQVPVPVPRDEIQRLALILNATFERLRTSFEQAKRFSADASHELKTPLTVLRTSIEALMDSPTIGEKDQDAVAGLLDQTRRLASIIESLLLLSRADVGRLALELAPADVGEIIEACVEDARIQSEVRKIKVEADLPESLHANVDRGRLSQIVVNLLDNAVKYNEHEGRVRIVARQVGGGLEVLVGNTGPGLTPEHASRIFERFYRAAQTMETAGHGLGLSLSRELARAHGGDLLLIEFGSGWTEFLLQLPSPSGTAPSVI